jgi:hypothetical protein
MRHRTAEQRGKFLKDFPRCSVERTRSLFEKQNGLDVLRYTLHERGNGTTAIATTDHQITFPMSQLFSLLNFLRTFIDISAMGNTFPCTLLKTKPSRSPPSTSQVVMETAAFFFHLPDVIVERLGGNSMVPVPWGQSFYASRNLFGTPAFPQFFHDVSKHLWIVVPMLSSLI